MATETSGADQVGARPVGTGELEWHRVLDSDGLPEGRVTTVTAGHRSLALTHCDGAYGALDNHCPHQGGPLCSGRLTGFLTAAQPGEYTYTRRGEILRCPWHGWEFDVKTGQSWFDPTHTRVRSYQVSVETVLPGAEAGLEKGPYTAETYPVIVEKPYVLVEI